MSEKVIEPRPWANEDKEIDSDSVYIIKKGTKPKTCSGVLSKTLIAFDCYECIRRFRRRRNGGSGQTVFPILYFKCGKNFIDHAPVGYCSAIKKDQLILVKFGSKEWNEFVIETFI